MTARLADILRAARHDLFVGREAERALLMDALRAPEPPFHVLVVHGPGGVGKTALLHEYLQLCQQEGACATYLDARHLEPTPDAVLRALADAFGLPAPTPVLEALAERVERHVLLLDTGERLAPLDGWLRETLLPQLPARMLLVLAGRDPPPPAWRSDPGWRALTRTVALRNLTPEESCRYLRLRAVPPAQHAAVLDFTHGHPLALSLVADSAAQHERERAFDPGTEPDVIRALLERFAEIAGVDPARRGALEAAAQVRVVTEPLLAAMLGLADAHDLFAWLRSLSFMEAGPFGLFPHDLVRDALALDLRWRNPDLYDELHQRARGYYAARLQRTQGAEQQRVLFDYVYLHRHNPVVRPFLEWQESGAAVGETPASPADVDALVAMVRRHEGDASARLAAHWLARQPHNALLFRDPAGAPSGFMLALALRELDDAGRGADPATRAATDHLARHAPLRAGEQATLFRYWMDREGYQAVSAVQSRIFVAIVRHYLVTPGLAFTFFPCADPDFWAPMLAYADIGRLPEADFVVGDRRYGMYGHDWRVVSPTAWLALLARRETGTTPSTAQAAPTDRLLVLSEPEFVGAVRDALRRWSERDALRTSPLLRSRMVAERAGGATGDAERVAVLRALVREAAAALRAAPRHARLADVLHHAYFRPAPSQERAAELLYMSFSTFRRHLKAAVGAVTAQLWRWELDGPPPADAADPAARAGTSVGTDAVGGGPT
ncbi:MAG TPA: ATP-binding protein [Gemmatimonadaceae bacterium]|nr:ATP-binding protein [Gemmatimonadaceae bacterium]